MRLTTPVYFQRVTAGKYEAASGNYAAETVEEEARYASVTDTAATTLTLVYGAIKQGSLTIRLQNHYTEPFDRIRIGNKLYRVDRERRLQTKHVFIVSEVQ